MSLLMESSDLAGLSTSLSYRKQGAASLLLEHFTKIADEKRLPAYVEATPAAVGIYRKYGFEQVDILRLELDRWKQGAYYNLCMIRRANAQSTP
jgi:predicted acetyltransferase